MITIITPTLNCVNTIDQTFDSIISLKNILNDDVFHIIGDAGSTDGTLEKIYKYENKYSWVELVHLHGLNIPRTLNILVEKVESGAILILNGDDYMLPQNMKYLYGFHTKNPSCIICGYVSVLSSNNKELGNRYVDTTKLNRYMSVNHPALLVDKSIVTRIGEFCETCPTSYDYLWCWECNRMNVSFVEVPVVASAVRLGGISQTRAIEAQIEILKYKIKLGNYHPSIIYFIIFIIKFCVSYFVPNKFLTNMKKTYRRAVNSIDEY